MQLHLFEHFNSEGHHCFLDEISIIFIDKKEEPFKTLKRENYLTRILKTMASWGLRVEESTKAQFIF